MDQNDSGARADRFAAYLADLASVLADARRHGPLASYCTGLLMPADRKSVEPMAAMTAPERTAAQHQSMLHFVGQCDWSDDVMMGKVRAHVVPRIKTHGAITAWIIDDTGFPKKGRHSVGVARQYCGQLWPSRTIARSPSRCRLPTTMRGCRWPIGCICRKSGPAIPRGANRRACPRM